MRTPRQQMMKRLVKLDKLSRRSLIKFLRELDAFEAMSRKSKFRAKSAVASFVLLLFTVAAHAADVKLAWNSPPEKVTHYELLWRTNTTYTNVSVVAQKNWAETNTVTGLNVGTKYFFSVRGVQAVGLRGSLSGELAYTVPAAATYRDVVTLEGRRYSGQPWLALSTNSFTIPTNQSYRLNIQRIKQ